ncbi:cobalamin biosynthesis protein CbiX [Paenibacillus sp. IB182496]|uniref:Cobalamin biosynthesis protein CbiX n=1 Tax=Paenibacillus sabuli TaxID=2772509 RepID=A0A927C0A0_9BACL|nr:CbiX/SirB N-terminal domain-containing protein [Paenibacillus sabuli]MBD2848543.1 cobalamin biosynthesis protein CbiX [Paenibacillus sabuli]
MTRGVLVVSHGSREPGWVRLVDEAVAQVAAPGGVPIVAGYLELVEGRLIQDGVDALERQGVTELYVLPLFVSSGSTHVDDITQAFGGPALTAERAGELPAFTVRRARVTVGAPMDADAEVAEQLLAHLRELSAAPARESVLLLGHGSELPALRARWMAGLRGLAEQLQARGGYARVETALLLPDEAGAALRRLQAAHPEDAVLVAPVFLSSGYFTSKVIPRRLAELDYRYNGRALLPGAAAVRWMERRIAAWIAGGAADRLDGGAEDRLDG